MKEVFKSYIERLEREVSSADNEFDEDFITEDQLEGYKNGVNQAILIAQEFMQDETNI